MTTSNTNDTMYSASEYEQLLAARARRAALKPTPIAPQPVQSPTTEQEQAKRRNASLNTDRGFSLLK
jgi:hypothetical protein